MTHPIEQLITQCLAADRAAQRQLYEQFRDFVMRICHRYATDLAEAKDMVQNTFVRVFQHLEIYDPAKGTFTTWLHRIAVRESIAVKRKKQQWNLTESALVVAESTWSPDIIERLTVEELRAVVEKLPDSHRTILMLYYFDGFSHEEVAALLQIELSSSRAKLSRAKSALNYQWNLIQQSGL